MDENKKLITVAQAAEILGRSKPAIYAALNSHPPRLHYHDPVRRLLLREGLEERFARSTRPRADYPLTKPPEVSKAPPEQVPIQPDGWDEIASRCNQLLDFSLWGPGPWSGDRWASLAGVIDLARVEAEAENTAEEA